MRPSHNLQYVPPHESLVRRFLSDVEGTPYRPLLSLEQARLVPGGAVVLEGDYGGIIYLTCPADLVRCDDQTLRRLLDDIDALIFNSPETAAVKLEVLRPGAGVWGGSGGGVFTGDVWLHQSLDVFELDMPVRDVLAGRRGGLTESTEALLLRAKASRPHDRRLIRRLAELYWRRTAAADGEERLAHAAKALAEFETLVRTGPPDDWPTILSAADAAFEAGAFATAATLADQTLRHCWRAVARGRYFGGHGAAICAAHSILGRIAHRAGDARGAACHLAEAAKAPFTAGTRTARPDAVLAQELMA